MLLKYFGMSIRYDWNFVSVTAAKIMKCNKNDGVHSFILYVRKFNII